MSQIPLNTLICTNDEAKAQKSKLICPAFSGQDGTGIQVPALWAWVLNHHCAMGDLYYALEPKEVLSNAKKAQIIKK